MMVMDLDSSLVMEIKLQLRPGTNKELGSETIRPLESITNAVPSRVAARSEDPPPVVMGMLHSIGSRRNAESLNMWCEAPRRV